MHDHNPGIVCLQETKLGTKPYNPGLNYNIFRSVPPPGNYAHGGAAILIRKSLQHSPVQLNTRLQAVAVKAYTGKAVTICSLYLPPSENFSENDILNLLNQLPQPYLVLGDFNAHNPLWGGNTLDAKGKIIDDIVTANAISLLNDGSMTYHNISTGTFSAIDLSICSSSIMVDYTWSVNEYLCGSDHYPIHLRYARNSPSNTIPKWKVEEADWLKFSKGIVIDREFEAFNCNSEAYDSIIEKTICSANNCIPKTKGKPGRPTVPWWNKTCGSLRKITRKCYRRYKTSGSVEAKIIYQRNMAKQRRYYKKVKRESWLCYINGINSQTPARTVWRKIKKLSGKFIPDPLPSLKVNDVLITDPSQVAEKLGEHFSNISSARNYDARFQDIRNAQISIDLSDDGDEPYNAKFTMREFRDALNHSEESSPGEDTILYSMLKHLPDGAKKFLLKVLNKIWETGIIPESWKISIVVPVRKPNKDPFEPTSYRPIALTSCVCKLMERMINARLVWHLEKNGLLSNFQFGFRKGRSTLDALLKLSNQIQQGFAKQCQTIGVFFDLEKAYDTTWRHGIIKNMYKMGIRGNMIRFINSFLSNRFIKVRVGSSLSSPFLQEEGVPQGSVLSVTCFAIAINNIMEAVGPPVKGTLFVDDFAIYCTGYDATSTCRHVQKSIDAISKWALENGFRFSASKTVAIRFTRRRIYEEVPTLTLNGNILPYENTVKFLGMTLDKKLTWSNHIDNLKVKVKNSLNILKVVSGFDWGADKKSLLKLYNTLCRSKLDYGCQIYSSACKTKLKELDVVHNMGLRICTGAFRTSPVESLYVDSHELPLDLRREELGLRYTMRLKSSQNNPSLKVLLECDGSKFGPRSSKPFQIRQLENLDDVIQRQKIEQVKPSLVPPWVIPEILCCSKEIRKKESSEEQIRANFLEHDNVNHQGQEKIYTDGSKSEDGVGCAIVVNNEVFQAKLPDSASIFTAEMTAIVQALEIVYNSKKKDFVIYSDSQSAIDSLKMYNTANPLVRKAQEWLFWIASRRKALCFCWIPAHVGISGNEEADFYAKEAARGRSFQISRVPHHDMKRPIKSYIWRKWQERWSSPHLVNNKKYRKIRESVEMWSSSFQKDRRVEIVLSRLRMGHTWLTHKFILEGGTAPVCAQCAVPLSVEHILVQCVKYQVQRRRFHLGGKSISQILDDEADISALMGFLKAINIFYEI